MQPIDIPIHYVYKPRVEYTQQDSYKDGKIYSFYNYKEAREFSIKHGGMVIHEQGKEFWYVFPSDIKGHFEVVSSMEEK